MKILATWDDGASQDMRVADLMDKYAIPTIFYWPCQLARSKNMGKVKSFLTMNQCIELSKRFEVGSHTVTHHYLTDLNTKQARNEIFESRKTWQDVTGQEINSFCYPRGRQNQIIRMLVKNAGYTNARTTAVGHLSPGYEPYLTPTTVHVGIDRVEYKGKTWEVYAREMLEKAKQQEDAVYHLFGHSWEIEQFGDWQPLEDLLKELHDVLSD